MIQKNLEKLESPSLTQLNESLWQQPWDILFFGGHSSSNSQGDGHIRINDTEFISVEQLKKALTKAIQKDLKLAIAFPALATGAARLSPEQAAVAMMTEIVTHLTGNTTIQKVTIALYQRPFYSINYSHIYRFYSRVSSFLDIYQIATIREELLADLERIFGNRQMPEAQQVIKQYQQELEKLKEEYLREAISDLGN